MEIETLFRKCGECHGEGIVPLHVPLAQQEDDDPVPMQADCVGECYGACPVCQGEKLVPIA